MQEQDAWARNRDADASPVLFVAHGPLWRRHTLASQVVKPLNNSSFPGSTTVDLS
jgi:hypothetical protein